MDSSREEDRGWCTVCRDSHCRGPEAGTHSRSSPRSPAGEEAGGSGRGRGYKEASHSPLLGPSCRRLAPGSPELGTRPPLGGSQAGRGTGQPPPPLGGRSQRTRRTADLLVDQTAGYLLLGSRQTGTDLRGCVDVMNLATVILTDLGHIGVEVAGHVVELSPATPEVEREENIYKCLNYVLGSRKYRMFFSRKSIY